MKRLNLEIKMHAKTTIYRFVFRVIATVIFAFIYYSLSAQTVHSDKALLVAKNFYSNLSQKQTLKSAKNISFNVAKIYNIKTTSNLTLKSAKKTPAYYVINISNNSGFIIVSGDERAQPILGYSLNGNFNSEQIPEHIQSFFTNYKKEISHVIKNDITMELGIDKNWNKLENANTKSATIPSNFNLISTKWGQGKNYNKNCPEDPSIVSSAYDGRVPAGCVAIVMSQIMHYWSWPETGKGTKCYTPTSNHQYGEQCANFESETYNYAAMVNNATSLNNEVANLIYHSAVSVKMDFSPTVSSTYSSTTVNAFKDHFNFSEKAKFVFKKEYSDTEWTDLLKTHLDNGVPLYYRGDKNNKSAHAFICDGYDTDNRFHFNWGWDGRYNGFFAISALAPYNNYNYSSNQGAIINIFPANDDFTAENLHSTIYTGTEGETVKLNYSQIYKGSDFNNLSVTYSYFLTNSTELTNNAILLGIDETILSSNNNIITINKDLTIPGNISDGEYYILIVADSDDTINEINESNNTIALQINIGASIEESNTKSTITCSDELEPNNSDNNSYYIGNSSEYYHNGLCLSEADEDWFEFIYNEKIYFVKINNGNNLNHGYYGIEFSFNNEAIEINTFKTENNSDTKISLYNENLDLIAEVDNQGNDLFAKMYYRPLSSTTSASNFNEADFKLYPNPAKEKIFIDTDIPLYEGMTITLMDMRGTLLDKKTFENIAHKSEYSLDITPYSDGQYIVGIYSGDGTFVTKKIIKSSWI